MDPDVEVTDAVDDGGLACDPPALSKYLSKAALAFPGGPKGVAFTFGSPTLSLLADLALCKILLAVDILLEVEFLLC